MTCSILILFDIPYLILNILFVMTVTLDSEKSMIQIRRVSQKKYFYGEWFFSSNNIFHEKLGSYYLLVISCFYFILFDIMYSIFHILFLMTVTLNWEKQMIQMRRVSQKKCLHGEWFFSSNNIFDSKSPSYEILVISYFGLRKTNDTNAESVTKEVFSWWVIVQRIFLNPIYLFY